MLNPLNTLLKVKTSSVIKSNKTLRNVLFVQNLKKQLHTDSYTSLMTLPEWCNIL